MKNNTKGYIMILSAGALWGTTGVFSRGMAAYGMNSPMAAFFRMLAAVLLMTVYMMAGHRNAFRMSRKGIKLCILQGLTTTALFSLSYIYAIEYVGMSTAAVLLYTSPIYVTILSRILFGEAITRNKIIALVINLAGCALTVSGGTFDIAKLSVFGILIGLFAGLNYSLLPILGRFGTNDDDPMAVSYYSQLFGLMFLIAFVRPWSYTEGTYGPGLFFVVLLCGLACAMMPYVLYMHGISNITETSKGPILASVENISASLIGVLIYSEFFNVYKALGIALVFASIVIMNTPAKASKEQ